MNNALQNYFPEQSVIIDESMVPYFGRHGCKQYMRNKAVKPGYKFWVAATPPGYTIQFYPYAEKDETMIQTYDSVVLLLRPWQKSYYRKLVLTTIS